MVDSVQLRLHDIVGHAQFVRNLKKFDKSKTRSDFTRFMKVVDFSREELENVKANSVSMMHDYIMMSDGHEVPVFSRKTLTLPSSHYTLAYMIKDDYVEFSFSIPKALYGCNITQFVTAPETSGVGVEKNTYAFQAEMLHKRMRHTILSFLKEIGTDAPIDLRKLEILSVDICYNQIFDSEKDAKLYIDWQKEIWKPRARKNSNQMRTFEHSLSYVTDAYTAKIYHKGEEYRKHDAKRHDKVNKELRSSAIKRAKNEGRRLTKKELLASQPFDVPALQNAANTMVRYEVHYRKQYLNKIAMQKFFRTGSGLHKRRTELWKQIRVATKSGERRMESFEFTWKQYANKTYDKRLEKHMINMIHKKGVKLEKMKRYTTPKKKSPVSAQAQFSMTEKMVYVVVTHCSKEEWKFYQAFENGMRKRRAMVFVQDEESAIWSKGGAIENEEGNMSMPCSLELSKDLIIELSKHFMNFMQSFQVKKMPDFDEAIKQVDDYNDSMEKAKSLARLRGDDPAKFTKVNRTNMVAVLKLVQKFPLHEIPDIMGYEERTWRRYKANLKKVGVTGVNVAKGGMRLKDIRIDFKRYYELADRLGRRLYINRNSYFH